MTAVEWLVDKLLKGEFINDTESLIEQAKGMEKQQLCDLVEQLKDYTYESHTILGYDERTPIEFVNIFLNKKQ